MSTTQFVILKEAVQQAFDRIKHLPLFSSNATKDQLWDTYLEKLTTLGHNEIYRERGEHDCQCCKHFIRRIGNIVALQEGRLISIWDHIETGTFYDDLAKAMDKLVTEAGIRGIFLHEEDTCGTDRNLELRDDGSTHTWEHFYLELPEALVEKHGETRRRKIGSAGDHYGSLKLSMEQLTLDAVGTVLELINESSLYRGSEHLSTVKLMKELLNEYSTQPQKEHWLWLKSRELGPRSTVRSTVIGTLVRDISSGMDTEQAVKSFEAKVAPANYKRPKALITSSMIKSAEQKVTVLGIDEALYRRPALITDITVNNVLFADKTATEQMDGVFGQLKATQGTKVDKSKAQDITVHDFMQSVLPTVTKVDALLENRLAEPNGVTLVAPVNPKAPNILRWSNNFTWTYNGDITDADIKERVAKAGGNVKGALRISLAWDCSDDLDLHVNCPKNGHVYFGNRRGLLDVDMNAGAHTNHVDPVENITYSKDSDVPKDSWISVKVNNYDRRGMVTKGFTVELEYKGVTHSFSYPQALRNNSTEDVIKFKVTSDGIVLGQGMKSTDSTQDVWGLSTEQFHRVSSVMLSPNHWDNNSSGNKHYFFMLDNFANPDDVRGLYNEFLCDDLREHRKVFEVLGNKLKAKANPAQLSGLGFSETIRNNLIIKVDGGRVYNIKF